MNNTENEAESIREEINEYDLKSYIPNKISVTMRRMIEDNGQNEKMLEFFRAKLKTYKIIPRDTYEEDFIKEYDLNIQIKELDKLFQDTFDCISKTIKEGEKFSIIIDKSIFDFVQLDFRYWEKWSKLIDQLKSNRITLKQFREEKPKEIKFLNDIEAQMSSIFEIEQNKKLEVDELKQKCTQIIKECDASAFKYALRVRELSRHIFEKKNKGNNNFKEKYLKYKGKYLLLKNKLNE